MSAIPEILKHFYFNVFIIDNSKNQLVMKIKTKTKFILSES